jgi:sulfonate transport system permease protein
MNGLASGGEPIDLPRSEIGTVAKQWPPHGWRMSPVGLIVPLSALIIWEIAARLSWLDRTITSSPTAILGEIWTLLVTGQIWLHLWATFVRVFSGFAWGSLVALTLGVISGIVPIVYRLLNQTIQAVRSVPSYAWVPLFRAQSF